MVLLIFAFVLIVALGLTLWKLKNYREDRKQRGLFRAWPIRQVSPEEFDPRFESGPLGPDRKTEIINISSYKVEGGISDFETWILCNLAREAERIFELGTCTGKTTYLLAANSLAQCEIVTITLSPSDLPSYKSESGDDHSAKFSAARESQFTKFVYSGSPVEQKITQLYGDSKEFNEAPYEGAFDLIFVDGSHARSYVESDSRKALRMVRPGGVIIWHDYRGPRRTPGVFQALNDLAKELPLIHIKGTSMVAYRHPGFVART